MQETLDVMHCSSEVYPFSKTGGLADVSYALPEALSRLGLKVTVVTPLYKSVDRQKFNIEPFQKPFEMTMGGKTFVFQLFHTALPHGTQVFLVGCDELFGRDYLYGTKDGDYPDNYLRFAFFSKAVFRVMRALRETPAILHSHDWQTGLVPAFNNIYHLDLCATVFTVHNLAYQGLFQAEVMPEIGMPWEYFTPEFVEFYGKVNFLKAGLVFSDRITTVSPQYAKEITTEDFGCGLHGLLKKREGFLQGILNGVDYTEWNPETDKFIPKNYSIKDLSGKKVCREALLKEFKVQASEDTPIFGMVGRLCEQKGFDIVPKIAHALDALSARLVVLGTGDRYVEELLKGVAARYPGKITVKIAYDNRLAHLIEAGSDFFFMPSRFEPCGLNQMYSMKYGTIPVVHGTGGLRDTVVDISNPNGTGIVFYGVTQKSAEEAIQRACELFKDQEKYGLVQKEAMSQDFSWDRSARAYIALYESLLGLK
jgi:starch synthase